MGEGATRITVLGGVSIETAGRRHAGLPGRRPEAVFAYLALERRRTVTREELADVLWPDLLPDSWAATLRGVVSDVRRWVQDIGWDIEHDHGGYRLRLPADVPVDVADAREALERARSAATCGSPRESAAQAARSAELCRAPFLPSADGEWVENVRRELANIRIGALDVLVRAHREAGEALAAAEAAEQLVLADPFNEAAHRLRIETLMANGDRAGAARAFDYCKRILADELGVAVSAETEAALRNGAPGPEPAPGRTEIEDLSVLLVEDHDFQRRTAVTLLHKLGVRRVDEAGDGVAALAALDALPTPDIVICDLDMPGIDGMELIRRIAERRLAAAVIIASGLEQSVLKAVQGVGESYGLQVLGAVEKPLTARRLTELLHRFRRADRAPARRVAVSVDDALRALDRGAVRARFRPVLDLSAGSLTQVEAVPDWRDDLHGPVRPGQLRELLASARQSSRLTDLLVELIAQASEQLRDAGLDVSFLVHLAEDDLADPRLLDRLGERAPSLPAHALTLLIDERVLRRATAAELDMAVRLRIKGFGLAADGLGRYGLDLSHLARAPLTALRLAPSVLGDAAAGDAGPLETIIDSAAVPVIATGCDMPEQFEALVSVGCRFAQGRLLGTPMPPGRLPGWAAGWTLPTSSETP